MTDDEIKKLISYCSNYYKNSKNYTNLTVKNRPLEANWHNGVLYGIQEAHHDLINFIKKEFRQEV